MGSELIQKIPVLNEALITVDEDWKKTTYGLLQNANDIKEITSNYDFEQANMQLSLITKHSSNLEKNRKTVTSPINSFKNAVKRVADEARQPLENAKNSLKKMIDVYEAELQRKADEERKKKEQEERERIAKELAEFEEKKRIVKEKADKEEAERVAKEKAEQEELKSAGLVDENTAFVPTPVPIQEKEEEVFVPTPEPVREQPKIIVPTSSFTKKVTRLVYEVTDINQVPRAFWELSSAKIFKYQQKNTQRIKDKIKLDPGSGTTFIPGITFSLKTTRQGG